MYGKRDESLWRLARSKIVLILLVVIIALTGNAAANMHGRYKEAKIRADRAEENLQSLNERKKELTANLERLGTARGREEELRKRFNVAGEGEGVIVIVDPRPSDPTESTEGTSGIWQTILNLFE